MENGKIKTNRRDFLKGAASAVTFPALVSALAACSTAPQDTHDPHLESREGKLVAVREILSQKIPTEEWATLASMSKASVLVIVDKKRNLFGLFKKGNGMTRIGAAGTARTSEGYVTTNGEHEISRLEGQGYTSKEYPGAKMDYASFFGPSGRAIHASGNFQYRYNRENGKKEWFIRLDNSHGCVNVSDEDALAINSAFRQNGGKGAVIVY